MNDQPVNLRPEGPPDTVLPSSPGDAVTALDEALAVAGDGQRAAVAAAVARFPRFLAGWAALAEITEDPVERYAYFRIGYHRGLDALRGSGWRGSGYVRWEHESNRGFLRSLAGLREAARAIGEQDEVERIGTFLVQLDPDRYA